MTGHSKSGHVAFIRTTRILDISPFHSWQTKGSAANASGAQLMVDRHPVRPGSGAPPAQISSGAYIYANFELWAGVTRP
jgi:hypothetical protein